MPQLAQLILHASAVSWNGKAVVIIGKSGSGKSSLALNLMAFGAEFVGDDRVQLEILKSGLAVRPVTTLTGMIEARGFGILKAETTKTAHVALCVDLDRTETERLPPQRLIRWLGVDIPYVHRVPNDAFPAAVLQYLKGGWAET